MFHEFQFSRTESGLSFDIRLEPGRRVYTLIGQNGVGKTALLESLARALWYCHAVWRPGDRGGPRSFRNLFVRPLVQERIGDRKIRVPDGTVAGVDLKAGESWDLTPVIPEPGGPRAPDALSVDRPFVFVPAHQRATVSNVLEAVQFADSLWAEFGETLVRLHSAAMREPVDVATVSTWFVTRLLLNPAFVVGRSLVGEVRVLLELLGRFDPAFAGLVRQEGSQLRFMIAYDDGALLFAGTPIDRLASGWTALIKVLQEIVSSVACWELARGSDDILASDALVFVDEVEAHLHPRWQRDLVPFLKTSFPNATFVLTTHSPLIVRDAEPGEAYELVRVGNNVTARPLGSPRDWYLSDVLSDAFHVDLPAPGSEGSPALVDVLLEFSTTVREFTASRSPDSRNRAIELYGAITPRLPDQDPRRRTVEQLKALLK